MDHDVKANIKEHNVSEGDVDPGFKQLFSQIAGKDSEISPFELRIILDKVVSQRTDIKHDGFTLDTCRNIVSLLDTDGSGTLGLVEFHVLWLKLQKYLEIFQHCDSDRSGTISSHELRGALLEAGFQLNNTVLQAVVGRFANAQYAMDFDSFVGCLIRIEMLFKMFNTLDRDKTGKIQLDVMQWLCLAVN
ncbi:CAN2 protein, partial [Amia calva]|nr:CAN2 protein [Amia calva]